MKNEERVSGLVEDISSERAVVESELPLEWQTMLARSAARHHHLCPRQILGARVGLAGAAAVGMDVPRTDKRLLVIVETDGCFISGVEAATGCCIHRRTMRMVDYGKIAAVFVNVITGQTVRVAPRPDVRQQALIYAPDENRRYFAMLHGYQVMPVEALLAVQEVQLRASLGEMISRPGVHANCSRCGEEIINERELIYEGEILCRACQGIAYYMKVP